MSLMHNLQADGLHLALLRSKSAKLHFVAFEPLMLKKSEFKSLKSKSLIFLGKKLPQTYIYRKGGIVGQATLGTVSGSEAVIVSAKERISHLGKPEPKYVSLESRMAVLPKRDFVVGKLVTLPRGTIEHILLFHKKELLATATLRENKEGYYLKIQEMH